MDAMRAWHGCQIPASFLSQPPPRALLPFFCAKTLWNFCVPFKISVHEKLTL
jgi:hypothetical protein